LENNKTHKTIRVNLDLELLCKIWDNRENPTDDLDTAIEKLLIKGLKTRPKHENPKNSPKTQKNEISNIGHERAFRVQTEKPKIKRKT
jgi:hypothetical protein